MRKISVSALFLSTFLSNFCTASEIKEYAITENTGLNKYERIGVVEDYLKNLSKTLQKIEQKVDKSSDSIKYIEKELASSKDEIQKLKSSLSKASEIKVDDEIKALKDDIQVLKNNDLNVIKDDLYKLRTMLTNLESVLKQNTSN